MDRKGDGAGRGLKEVLDADLYEQFCAARPTFGRRARRTAIEKTLTGLGAPTTRPVVEMLERLSGLTVHGVDLSIAHLRSLSRRYPPATLALAVPVGVAPSDGILWIDGAGVIYDDTDLESVVPVGRGHRGLLDYVLNVRPRGRWSGAVHGAVAQVADIPPQAIAACIGADLPGVAVGARPAVWPPTATAVCDALDQTRKLFDVASTFSAPSRVVFAASLRALADAHPGLQLRLDMPSPPWSEPSGRVDARIRAFDAYREELDGELCLSDTGGDDVLTVARSTTR